jgi:hypothetical protein
MFTREAPPVTATPTQIVWHPDWCERQLCTVRRRPDSSNGRGPAWIGHHRKRTHRFGAAGYDVEIGHQLEAGSAAKTPEKWVRLVSTDFPGHPLTIDLACPDGVRLAALELLRS